MNRRVALLLSLALTSLLYLFLFQKNPPTFTTTKTEVQSASVTNIRKTQHVYLPILLYHYVENVQDPHDLTRNYLNTEPLVFISQIETLTTNGYTFVTLDQLVAHFNGTNELPKKPILLTFDDGYQDFYTDALPIIEKYRVPVVLYVVTGFLDATPNYLTHAQLEEIARSPYVELGAHTVNHPNFFQFDENTISYEIIEGKRKLETLTGREIRHFAYPFGEYNSDIVAIVKDTGFETAVSVDPGVMHTYDARFTLKRIRAGNFTGEELLKLIGTN